ncbi:hypothetical protein [Pectobacterium brasiliense]|uniref:hypothetical protein n=1 Tax=Pectobacterium brasiliense TaxID=180957 RepID=UPI00196993D2|nr:hypothetical protein [Pectobacterium brasiliense]MBN3263555.1 hypothetical protein [Pectobacterium brasiliense]
MSDIFTKLDFENGTDITQAQLANAVEQYKYVQIDLTNGHFSPNIYVPDEVPLINGDVVGIGLIYVTNAADEKSVVHVYELKYTVARGESVTLVPNPYVKMWGVVQSPK